MSQFKKILVPIDFSEQSVNALKYASSLAKDTRAEVIVLHVVKKGAHVDYQPAGLPLKVITRLPCPVLLAPTVADDVRDPHFGPYEPVGDAWIESDSLIALDHRL